MLPLNDLEIRQNLILRLSNQRFKPRAILEELRVHNGNAIADIVALYEEAHCYEIKGSNDKIERIVKQGSFYDTSFRKITLVTTENHLEKAQTLAPQYWGIMLVKKTKDQCTFKSIRSAKNNPNFTKNLASLMLWKSEMLQLLEHQKLHSKPREFLAKKLSESRKKAELNYEICNLLFDRYKDQCSKEEHL
ncbi:MULTISPECIES: sce7726 family protein [unclassified Acinetobacter]|uniref:sce7726 family protein n=1 Tax=unclassified Acinetobacter TaxID=196816 RepID=UPI0004D3C506|nr:MULTISPECIES: sce7726 family protein [unclassified Acinetobacter]KEC86329.1 hypothetical protein DT74_00340 [Acinetobacter sp. ETR1]WEE39004.1 sce7726 family protein [Acinetobacter sp. TAC-1]